MASILEDVYCLLFDDDIQIISSVSSIEDYCQIQWSLLDYRMVCKINMRMNIDKYAIVSLCRTSTPLPFDETLCNSTLRRKSSIRDLGVIFFSNMSPELHIDDIVGRASRMLGFIVWVSSSGLSVAAMRIAYTALVRS